MSDLISRADAMEEIKDAEEELTDEAERKGLRVARFIIGELPSAETHDLRTETHGVCLISKDDAMGAVQGHFNDDGFKGYDDGQKMMDRIKALPSADAVSREFYEDAVKANIRLVIENRKLKEQIESADAVPIHEDGTLEVKVPNAHKVGRVLVMDTDSHIGGGLFYPDEAEPHSEQYKKGFEDAKRAFLVEYARESENMRKRNAQLEVMLNAQKAISAVTVQGEWIEVEDYNGDVHYKCDQCGEEWTFPFGTPKENNANFCPNCGARMKGGDDE